MCPDCGKLIDFDICYGAYICDCGFMDDSYNKERREKFLQMVAVQR